MLILMNVTMQLYIMLWLHYFGSAGSGSALFWSHCWICCRRHLAALVLDDLQCRSFSLPHTHTHTSSACCWVTWQSPPCTLAPLKLPTIYWALPLVYVLVMIPHRWQAKKEERKCEKEGDGVCRRWNEATLSPSGMCLFSPTISSALILCYILSVIFGSF